MGFFKKLGRHLKETIKHPTPTALIGLGLTPVIGPAAGLAISGATLVTQAVTQKEASKSSTQIVVRRDENITISPPQNVSGVSNCSVHKLGPICQLNAYNIDPVSGASKQCTINAALCTVCGCYVDSGSGVVISYQ